MPQQPSIAIVGAGPAGLTAANIFHRHGWACSLFEADASATSREQGGSLDLHPNEGQLGLKKAGLLDAFLAAARHEDQEQRIVDYASGNLVYKEVPEVGMGERPEIDRYLLRRLLLQPLGESAIHWNTPIERVELTADGRVELVTKLGSAGVFNLVIGADGAWSKVRSALTEVRPDYTGVTFVELLLNDVDRQYPVQAELVGHGSLFSLHDGMGIIAQRNGNATIRVYAAFRTLAAETNRPDKTLSSITQQQLLSRFSGWAPSLLSLITTAEKIIAVRAIVTLPVIQNWHQRDGITLIGDAAHVMPPLGVGVNLAMLDAAELAEALVQGADWRQAVRAFEEAMLERSSRISVQCNRAFDQMFSRSGLQTLLDDVQTHRGC